MARPEKNNVEYFPFICEDGKKMFYIEETYGNDGFATFVKLLRELAKADNHYLNLSSQSTVMFLSAKCKVPKEKLISIVNDLVELGKFDKVLWNENSIIWCQDFVDSIQDAYKKRINKCITYDGLLSLLIGLGIRKQDKSTPKVSDKPQSKVEETKEEEKSKEVKEIIEVEAVASPPVVKKEKFSIEKFTDPSNLPFTGDEFISKWEKLLQTKKWRNKSESAIEETVAKMQRFNEEFMTRQIQSALVGEWQGLFFSNTESDFQKFLQGNGKTTFEKKVQGMNSTAAMALQLLTQKEFDNEHGN